MHPHGARLIGWVAGPFTNKEDKPLKCPNYRNSAYLS